MDAKSWNGINVQKHHESGFKMPFVFYFTVLYFVKSLHRDAWWHCYWVRLIEIFLHHESWWLLLSIKIYINCLCTCFYISEVFWCCLFTTLCIFRTLKNYFVELCFTPWILLWKWCYNTVTLIRTLFWCFVLYTVVDVWL